VVKSYNSGTWGYPGGNPWVTNVDDSISLAVYGTTVYVAYRNSTGGLKVYSSVGGTTAALINSVWMGSHPSLAVDSNGILYFAYNDDDTGGVKVQYYDGSWHWVVNSGKISIGSGYDVRVETEGIVPYVYYVDDWNNNGYIKYFEK